MATIILRNTKGSPLTSTEMDNNFNNLNIDIGNAVKSADLAKAVAGIQINSGVNADSLTFGTGTIKPATSNTISSIVVRDSNGAIAAGAGAFNGGLNVLNGNVGIGTNNPTQILTLASNNNFPFIHWNNSTNTTIAFAGWHGGTSGGDDFRIGTQSAKAVTLHTNNIEAMRIDTSGNLFVGGSTQNTSNKPVYASTTAKAWANFDGTLTGTITPRANYNMSSITKSSTGTYIGNFTTALANANYAAVSDLNPNSISNVTNATHSNAYPNNASSVNILHRAGGNTPSVPGDVTQMSIVVFG